MPELRKDPIMGRWVIVSHERALRPDQFKITPQLPKEGHQKNCAFCEGNESLTPTEIIALRKNSEKNSPGWQIRVVPNKYPALKVEGNLDKQGEGMYDMMNGVGAHEVIIESPKHELSLSALSEERITDLIQIYKQRILDLRNDKRLVFCLIFKNVGEAAGASLEHTHSQLIATPIVPLRVKAEIDYAKQYYDFRGRCVICDMIKQELSIGTRVVLNSENFISLEPFAPRFPFETWILPKNHISHFEATENTYFAELAKMLRQTILKIEKVSNNPPYNYLIHTTPISWESIDHYHWHIEILPRLTRVAGFEWGSGFYINPVPPENAATFLREVNV